MKDSEIIDYLEKELASWKRIGLYNIPIRELEDTDMKFFCKGMNSGLVMMAESLEKILELREK